MNMTRAPFDDLKVREAVNYAVSPEALERIYAGSLKSLTQILPEGLPGHKTFDLYPYDLAKAKELIAEAKPSDTDITIWTDTEPTQEEAGAYYQDQLKKLGFSTKLKILNADDYFTIIGNASTPDLDTGWVDWYQDYPHPNDFFQPLLAGESILPTNNNNFANIDDPKLNAKIAKLRRRTARPQAGSRIRRNGPRIHGTGAVGALRAAHADDVRLERNRPRQDHLQPDLRAGPDELPVQVAARAAAQ